MREGMDLAEGLTVSPERMQDLISEGLDRLSPIPLYHQLAQNLRNGILSGAIPVGATLGNEILLAESVGVGRPTLRQALQELVDAGLLVRRRGVGTQVVRPRPSAPTTTLYSLWDDMQAKHRRLTSRVLRYTSAEAGAALSDVFNILPEDQVITIKRLRVLEGAPFALTTSRLPQRFAPAAERLVEGGLYDSLRRRGIMLRVAQQRVSARQTTAEEAELLGMGSFEVVLVVARTVFDDSGTAILSGETTFLASRFELESTLVNR